MANTTKKNTKSKTNKTTKNSKTSKGSSNVIVRDNEANYREIAAIIIIAACIFVVVCLFGEAGIVGNFIRSVLLGIFGLIATILTVITLVALAISILRGTHHQTFRKKNTISMVALFVLLSALLHSLTPVFGNYKNGVKHGFGPFIASLWKSTEVSPFGGGLIGGGISSMLLSTIGRVGTLVILVPATLILLMLLFKFSLLPFFKKAGEFFSKIGSGISSAWENMRKKSDNEVVTEVKEKDVNIIAGGETLDDDNDANTVPPVIGFEQQELEILPEIHHEEYTFDLGIDYDDSLDADFEGNMNENSSGSNHDIPETADEMAEQITFTIDDKKVSSENDKVPVKEPEPKKNENNGAPVGPDMPTLSEGKYSDYVFPPLDLLDLDMKAKKEAIEKSKAECANTSALLKETLKNFNVDADVIDAYVGPTVTRYELRPKVGVRMETFSKLSNEIAFYLAAESIRIEAPIPGKSAVGIEVPNKARTTIYLKEILKSEKFKSSKSILTAAVGYDIQNTPIICDIAKLPHLLIAGTTGSGKSVCTNGIIMSLLYKASPEDVRLILIDPKILEFSKYNGIPHLLLPVVTDAKKAASALAWAVLEMDKRYAYLAKFNVSDITAYNELADEQGLRRMPRIIIIIDELADLMNVAKKDVEISINRIAQKARACGMHLILATQSPRADVVTGLIKANITSRVGLRVSNGLESRIVLDQMGAEKLLGYGDMIFAPSTDPKSKRVQGVFTSAAEIKRVVDFISDKSRGDNYDENVISKINEQEESSSDDSGDSGNGKDNKNQDLYKQAIDLAMATGEISTSYIQRRLGIGYNKAADIMDRMEAEGIIERGEGSKKSKVIKRVE